MPKAVPLKIHKNYDKTSKKHGQKAKRFFYLTVKRSADDTECKEQNFGQSAQSCLKMRDSKR